MKTCFLPVGIMILAVMVGCSTPAGHDGSSDGVGEGDREEYAFTPKSPIGVTHGKIVLESLTNWTRHPDNPVYRDPCPGYEVAADSHVFHDSSGTLRMIYTGDHDGHTSIKMANGSAYDIWKELGLLLPGDHTPTGEASGRETAFYHFVPSSNKHQIYYIAYQAEDPDTAYAAEIYLAEADSIEGPYSMPENPIVSRGTLAGEDVHLMTSPSVVEHEGRLYLAFLAWNAPPTVVTMVWPMGTVSEDNGQTWGPVRKIEAPIGMEGQITKGPDGLYYTVSTRDYLDSEAIFLARSEDPFGPYDEEISTPLIEQAGQPWELHEVIAPQLVFNPISRRAYLYYTGADYAKGYWVMVTQTSYSIAD